MTMMQTTTKVATALLALTNAVFFVSANYPVVRYKNGTVAVLNEGGEVRVKSDEFVVYGNLSISGNLTVNGTNVGALDANITAVDEYLEIFCYNYYDFSQGNGNLPSSLTHWFDFSDKQVTYSTVNSKVKVSGFVDKMGNATDLTVNGVVEFVAGVTKKGRDSILVNTDYSGLEFKTTKLGRNPEVFVVFNQISYVSTGVLLGDRYNGYHFGTYAAGDGNIGCSNTAGNVMAKTNATYGDWHVADVYFGDSDGFLAIDSDIWTGGEWTPYNQVSFGINGQYSPAQTHTNPLIGFYPWTGHNANAYIAEVMYFNQKLTYNERYWVKTYLYEKWVKNSCTNSGGNSAKMDELRTAIKNLMAPKCTDPGGAKLYYNGTGFECACAEGYYGTTCEEDQYGRSTSSAGRLAQEADKIPESKRQALLSSRKAHEARVAQKIVQQRAQRDLHVVEKEPVKV
jgi:hypothetical protein